MGWCAAPYAGWSSALSCYFRFPSERLAGACGRKTFENLFRNGVDCCDPSVTAVVRVVAVSVAETSPVPFLASQIRLSVALLGPADRKPVTPSAPAWPEGEPAVIGVYMC